MKSLFRSYRDSKAKRDDSAPAAVDRLKQSIDREQSLRLERVDGILRGCLAAVRLADDILALISEGESAISPEDARERRKVTTEAIQDLTRLRLDLRGCTEALGGINA